MFIMNNNNCKYKDCLKSANSGITAIIDQITVNYSLFVYHPYKFIRLSTYRSEYKMTSFITVIRDFNV